MRIATWNVNSIRARLDRVLGVLERHDLDVLALQEIKCKEAQFPLAEIEAAGYKVAMHGLNQWNGVAIISRVGLAEVQVGFPGQPGFTKDPSATPAQLEARAIGARVGAGSDGDAGASDRSSVMLWSVYVPNGRAVGDPHYHYKLDFLQALREYAAQAGASGEKLAAGEKAPAAGAQQAVPPSPHLLIVGDWNVIPTDADVWDPRLFAGELYATDAERKAFAAFERAGMVEVTRPLATNFTFWDYKQLHFPRNEGMRIDYMYASAALADRARSGQIDRDERKGKGASDHVPVIVDFDL